MPIGIRVLSLLSGRAGPRTAWRQLARSPCALATRGLWRRPGAIDVVLAATVADRRPRRWRPRPSRPRRRPGCVVGRRASASARPRRPRRSGPSRRRARTGPWQRGRRPCPWRRRPARRPSPWPCSRRRRRPPWRGPTCSAALSLTTRRAVGRARRPAVRDRAAWPTGRPACCCLRNAATAATAAAVEADSDEPLALAAALLRDGVALEHREASLARSPPTAAVSLAWAAACSRCGAAASRACSAPAARAAAAVAMAAPTFGSTVSTSVDCAASTLGLARSAASCRPRAAVAARRPDTCASAARRRSVGRGEALARRVGGVLERRCAAASGRIRRSLAAAAASLAVSAAVSFSVPSRSPAAEPSRLPRRAPGQLQPPCGTAWFGTFVLLGPLVLTHPAKFGTTARMPPVRVGTPCRKSVAVSALASCVVGAQPLGVLGGRPVRGRAWSSRAGPRRPA